MFNGSLNFLCFLFNLAKSLWLTRMKFSSSYIFKFISKMTSNCSTKRKVEEVDSVVQVATRKRRYKFDRSEEGDSEYYFERGLRKVYPYNFTFHAHCKGRWIGSKIFDVYQQEFRAIKPERLAERFEKGYIKVGGEVVSPDYILKDNDVITGKVHRHELPVIGLPLKFVHEDDNVIALDKPPSIPIHSCGRFHLNSVATILRKEHGLEDFHICHRLDRLTSGLVILAKNRYWARKVIDQITQRLVEKEYICKVEGEFPEEEIDCDKPLYHLDFKVGLQVVDEQLGKNAFTSFKRISTNGKTSLVRCKPKTGRTHQIRVHLQYLGYPIANDPLYNCSAFGPAKGKNGDYGGATLDELKERIYKVHPISHYENDNSSLLEESLSSEELSQNHDETDKLSTQMNKAITDDWREFMKSKSYDPTKMTVDQDCEECKAKYRDPNSSELLIYLHCVRYKGLDFDYQTELPFWALE